MSFVSSFNPDEGFDDYQRWLANEAVYDGWDRDWFDLLDELAEETAPVRSLVLARWASERAGASSVPSASRGVLPVQTERRAA